MRSKLSILAFPFTLDTDGLMETRELRGARMKDASSMKDGSSLSIALSEPRLYSQQARQVTHYSSSSSPLHVCPLRGHPLGYHRESVYPFGPTR